MAAAFRLAWAGLERRLLRRRLVTRRVADIRLWLDLEDQGLSRQLLLDGLPDRDQRLILERVLRPGMTVFDIGAGVGCLTLSMLGLVGAEGQVVAVEPSPPNLELLRKNLSLNAAGDWVTVVAAAVGERSGACQVPLSRQIGSPSSGGSSETAKERIDVEAFTVLDLVARFGSPDLIRIDVSDGGGGVIAGLLEAVQRGEMAPMILLRAGRARAAPDRDLRRVLQALFDCGYRSPLATMRDWSSRKIIEQRGYKGGPPFTSDGETRMIFEDMMPGDLVDLACYSGELQSLLLAKDLPGDERSRAVAA